MLLSQRIAKDPNFLQSKWKSTKMKEILIDLRMKIIRGVKIVVGHELMDTAGDSDQMNMHIFGTKSPSEEAVQKRAALYHDYARPPYPLVVLENDSGILVVEQQEPKVWKVITIINNGRVLPLGVTVGVGKEDKDTISFNKLYLVSQKEFESQVKALTSKTQEEYLDMASAASFKVGVASLESFLFMNIRNTVTQEYTPTKKENASVPKPLLPFYTYRVLDIYREGKRYESLQEIQDRTSQDNPENKARRAHFVRGHFKRTKTGLFWWSPFVRNSKNSQTSGVVDKDYRLNKKDNG